MAFEINKTFIFIDNMQFLNFSLDVLVKFSQIMILSIDHKNLVVIW